MRLKIRRFFQVILHRRIGKPTIDPPHIYEPRRKPPERTVSVRAHIAQQAAIAGQTRTSMRRVCSSGPSDPPTAGAVLLDDLQNASQYCCDGRTLRTVQEDALSKIFSKENVEKKLIVVQPTGIGKSFIMMMTGLMLAGVHLIVHPLLTLTADQVAAFSKCSDNHGSVVVINLDEQASRSSTFQQSIVDLITGLPKSTSTTVFLFASPQFLARFKKFRNAIFTCNHRGTLRSLMLDEVHLLSQHGSSFRPEIRMICDRLIKPIMAKPPSKRPHHLQLTATLSTGDRKMAGNLTGVGFPAEYTFWAKPEGFRQDAIKIQYRIGSDYTASLKYVVDHLRNHATSAFVFANARRLTQSLTKTLEDKLDEEGITCDVVHIHGKLDKVEKFHLVNLFCQKTTVDLYDPRVAVATSTSDHGVDHPDAQHVINMEWPDSVSTLVQRKGRASRAGQAAIFMIIAGLTSHIMLVRRIWKLIDVQANDDDDDESDDNIAAVNMAFQPEQSNSNKCEFEKAYPLKAHERQNLIKHQIGNLNEVMRLICLDEGCIQRRLEHFCYTGKLSGFVATNSVCGKSCPVCCTKERKHFFKPLRKEGVIEFFDTVGDFPLKPTYDSIMGLVWKDDFYTRAIFDLKVGSVNKFHVEAMFLQLVAARLIAVEPWKGQLRWVVCREAKSRNGNGRYPPYRWKNDANWEGITVFAADHAWINDVLTNGNKKSSTNK
jgi:superfamily II DNA helicase RecQ